jgi:uroporphyrinogen-III decarboxylase
MDQIVVDMIQDPPFVHNLMSFLITAQKRWKKQRAEFMGVSIQPACLFNDEVNIPTLSPQLYEQFVLPYEIKLSEYHNGISYWHSCGNTTLIQNAIKNIPNLEMIHVSPWTDLKKTVENLYDSGIALEIVLHPLNDVQKVSKETAKKGLSRIKELTDGLCVTVRADAFEVITSLDYDIAKIKEWGSIARSVL